MDQIKTGRLLRALRQAQGMTQRTLAAHIGVSDKAGSKWERGCGAPDIALLPQLSQALQVDLHALLRGALEENDMTNGNLNKLRIYVCPDCGNLLLATDEAAVSCCGRALTPLYAVFHDDDKTFSLLWTAYDAAFPAFHAAFLADRAQYGAQHGVLAKKRPLPPENAYTVSCLPWIGFDHFAVHSYGSRPYYFPSVEAGKFCEEDGCTLLPLSVTCHHAASGGWHVSRFLTRLQQGADAFDAFL